MPKHMTKHRIVLSLGDFSRDTAVAFVSDNSDDDESGYMSQTHLDLDKTVWREMGEPTTITVTVEPGDKLNEED